MSHSSNLEVLLIDPCFGDMGVANPMIPLPVGLIGSYLKKQIPEISVTVLKKSTDILSFLDNKKPDVLGICNYLWNTNLANRLSRYAQEINPNTYIVFGGPEINKQPVDKKIFFQKYSHVDMLIAGEGELAFIQLIKIYLEEGRDSKKVRLRINELGNCFYINEQHQFVSGPQFSRIKHIDDVPSPYITGLFDHFLEDDSYQPLIQTNRGCPYKCTYCTEGSDYYNRIIYRSVDYVKNELDYIAERVNPSVGVFIVDSNWGMYKQDVEIALHMRKLQDKYNWPMQIGCNTGKSQLPRIKNVAEILGNALIITNAMQSRNNDVLDAIKRKNASNMDEFVKGLDSVSVPELILPLPKETKKTFMDGLNGLLDIKSPVWFTVYPALLLCNTEMNSDVKNKNQDLRLKYRQHQNLVGWVAGELVCETECNIYSTDTMNEEDVWEARKYVILMATLLREEPLNEIFYYLDSKGIKRSALPMSLYNNIDTAPNEIQKCFNQYINSIISECFVTEKEVFEYMRKHDDDYKYGRKGGDLLRYSQKFWIDYFDTMMEWIFQHLNIIFTDIKGTKEELNALHQFLILSHYERSREYSAGKPSIEKKFDYDILRWMEDAPNKKLSEFKKVVTYYFKETKFSKLSKEKIWKSFGFNLSSKEKYNNQWFKRLWISRTQRRISRGDKDSSKQRMTHATSIAEKIGL